MNKHMRWMTAAAIGLLVATANAQLHWDPAVSGGTALGGSGTWNNTNTNWWNDASNVAYSGAGAIFGGTDGTYAVTLENSFTNQTALNFTANGYTITGTGQTLTGSASVNFIITAGSGNTATLTGLNATSSRSSDGALTITGGGTVVLGNGTVVSSTNTVGGQMRILDGTTVNILAGGELRSERLTRVNGNINVNGGSYVSLNPGNGDGVTLGQDTTSSLSRQININSGSAVLEGGRDGVRIGVGGTNTSGGIVNLNGGTLTTTSIFAASAPDSASKSRTLNFNGGELIVSGNATQAQLDGFIRGFGTAANHSVNSLAGGAIINTGSIDNATNGVVTIQSVIQGVGGLTLRGGKTLLLEETNTYTGQTHVESGILSLGVGNAIATSSGLRLDITDASSFGSVSSASAFDFDNALVLDFANTLALNDVLGLFDVSSFAGNFSTVSATGTYTGTFAFNGTDTWSGSFNGTDMQLSLTTGNLSVIPEPGTVVLVGIFMAVIGVSELRKRRH